ncbi:hypothetical protein [Burkholderia cenocepacia]|uniref:hypothetical protein n=1 Tax=Burkholderia cenocepacia TaxID=95486 RepID=UPI000AC5D6C1|nr:hypothetical protein [Burkholderia cenocepacia]
MRELLTEIPDVDVLLVLEPEELAGKMLLLLRARGEHQLFNVGTLRTELWDRHAALAGRPQYPQNRSQEVDLAIAEALAWLEAQALIVPAEGVNGQNGFRHLSRRARQFENEAAFTDYRTARLLPKDLLHPSIANDVWLSFMRGAFPTHRRAGRCAEFRQDALCLKLGHACWKSSDAGHSGSTASACSRP